ncbi:hypothetical protein ACFX10_017681 [Malus domestica]
MKEDDRPRFSENDIINWATRGTVSLVAREQFIEGTCTCFSVAETVEAAYRHIGGDVKAETLSAQDLAIYVGSPYKLIDDVISGGKCWPEFAYSFIIKQGMLTEEQCSYESKIYKELAYNNRRPRTRKVPRFHIDDFKILRDEKLIVEALKTIPALAMVISIDEFFFEWEDEFEIYELKPQACDNMYDLHTVTVVGYGRCNITGKEYWIIKNSWGNKWGDKGFAKILKGSKKFVHSAFYPVIYKERSPSYEIWVHRHVVRRNACVYNECCLSFRSLKSDGELFIDLTTYLAFGKNYVRWNHEKTGNPVYLHILKKDMSASEDNNQKTRKRSVPGNIGSVREEPVYEITKEIVIFADDGQVQKIPYGSLRDEFKEAVDFYFWRRSEILQLQTEHTAERNLNQNTNFDGSQTKKAFGGGYTGLTNLGNSSYMAATMQVVLSTSLFSVGFYDVQSLKEAFEKATADPSVDLNMQTVKLAHGLLSGEYSLAPVKESEKQEGIPPQMFKTTMAASYSKFSSMKEQDAYEFFLHFLIQINNLHTDGGRRGRPMEARLNSFPKYLVMHMQRFVKEPGVENKLDVRIDVDDIINIGHLHRERGQNGGS